MNQKVYIVRVGDRELPVEFLDDTHAIVDGTACAFDVAADGGGGYSVLLNGSSFAFAVDRSDGSTRILVDGAPCTVDVETMREHLLKSHLSPAAGGRQSFDITAPMPSLVVRIAVSEGQTVQEGEALLVLEAMKMENEVKALRGGTITKIHVECGKAVEKGELLLSIE